MNSIPEFAIVAGLIVLGAIALWLAYIVLKWLLRAVFVATKAVYVLLGSVVPGVSVYVVTHFVFGVGVTEASIPGVITAAAAGFVVSKLGGGDGGTIDV